MVAIVLFGEIDVTRKPPPISQPGAMGDRGGQNGHVPVINGSPVRCDLGRPGLVSQCDPGIITVLGHHQLIKPHGNGRKGQQAQQQCRGSDPAVLSAVLSDPLVLPFPGRHRHPTFP